MSLYPPSFCFSSFFNNLSPFKSPPLGVVQRVSLTPLYKIPLYLLRHKARRTDALIKGEEPPSFKKER